MSNVIGATRFRIALRAARGGHFHHGLLGAGLLTLGVACADDSPTAPTGGASPPVSGGNVITITAAGASPQTITIRLGARVLFTNNDTVDHEMSSDDHPTHEHCPQINQVGYLRPGDTRETGNFTEVETCSFHDHIELESPDVVAFIGRLPLDSERPSRIVS